MKQSLEVCVLCSFQNSSSQIISESKLSKTFVYVKLKYLCKDSKSSYIWENRNQYATDKQNSQALLEWGKFFAGVKSLHVVATSAFEISSRYCTLHARPGTSFPQVYLRRSSGVIQMPRLLTNLPTTTLHRMSERKCEGYIIFFQNDMAKPATYQNHSSKTFVASHEQTKNQIKWIQGTWLESQW